MTHIWGFSLNYRLAWGGGGVGWVSSGSAASVCHTVIYQRWNYWYCHVFCVNTYWRSTLTIYIYINTLIWASSAFTINLNLLKLVEFIQQLMIPFFDFWLSSLYRSALFMIFHLVMFLIWGKAKQKNPNKGQKTYKIILELTFYSTPPTPLTLLKKDDN